MCRSPRRLRTGAEPPCLATFIPNHVPQAHAGSAGRAAGRCTLAPGGSALLSSVPVFPHEPPELWGSADAGRAPCCQTPSRQEGELGRSWVRRARTQLHQQHREAGASEMGDAAEAPRGLRPCSSSPDPPFLRDHPPARGGTGASLAPVHAEGPAYLALPTAFSEPRVSLTPTQLHGLRKGPRQHALRGAGLPTSLSLGRGAAAARHCHSMAFGHRPGLPGRCTFSCSFVGLLLHIPGHQYFNGL